jgi:hypothetical protein
MWLKYKVKIDIFWLKTKDLFLQHTEIFKNRILFKQEQTRTEIVSFVMLQMGNYGGNS